MRKSNGNVYMLGSSHQGSTSIAVLNGSGAVSRQLYTPFGGPRGAANQLPGERGFLGQTQDSATSLVYLNARYYDPKLMRFISCGSNCWPARGIDSGNRRGVSVFERMVMHWRDSTARHRRG